MSFQDINQPQLWGIMHLPSGKLLRQQVKGYGHTQLAVEDAPDSRRVEQGIILPPRLFTSEDTAKRALTVWLQGVHHNDWEDGIIVYTPEVPRNKQEMKVVPIYLYTDSLDEDKS